MKLKRVMIKNFRSIADLNLDFYPQCQALVGLNESGKSNILKALRLLSAEYNPTPDDMRDPLSEEKPIDKSYVWFIFRFEEEEKKSIYNGLMQHLLLRDVESPFITNNKELLSVKDYCATLSEGLYIVDIRTGKKFESRWASTQPEAICERWKGVSKTCPIEYKVVIDKGNEVPLVNFKAVNVDDFPEIPSEYLNKLTTKDVVGICGPLITGTVKNNLPTCIFWEYSDNNLLPGKIDFIAFNKDPNAFTPLKIMFNLADISDIPAALTAAKFTSNGTRNLLNRVAGKATKHIQSIWKEYRGISIFLSENGPHIDAGVQDESNFYNFASRSDGFKRFITFLLLISAKERTKQLSNSLILIDEPDICLHPSGVKYLRDELLKISSSNYVLYATHSIFMIDRENTSRHLIVTKDKEVTTVKRADTSNILDEEVIYNALGYSVFEGLKKTNIIFEGWRDKNLFRVALKSKGKKATTKQFDTYGTCHAEGVKDIPRISSTLDLANRKFIVISDDDPVAIQYQKRYKGVGKWLRYSEILGSGNMTSEDFVKSLVLGRALSESIRDNEILKGKELPSLNRDCGRLETVKQWLNISDLERDDQNIIITNFKEYVFSHLKPGDIEERYFAFLKQLLRAIDET